MNTIGLTTQEAENLLKKYGLNQLPSKQKLTVLKLLFSQVKNTMSLLLFAAAFISLFLGDFVDSLLIFLILGLNIVLGFYQEYKASKELEALRKLEVSTSRVIRDGVEKKIPSYEVVPGDIVILEAGDKVPADGSLIENFELSVNEASLTGESAPVAKGTKESENQLFFGTVVVGGRGKFQVIKTGKETKFGSIALTLADIEEGETPLETALSNLAKKVGIVAVALAVLILGIRVFQGFDITEVFFTSVALIVAVVPESLPVVLTVILAIGVHRMYKRHALIRKLSAIESLGAATVICTDKTGTLTENKMHVKETMFPTKKEKDLLEASILCSSATLVMKDDKSGFDVLGDTTEGALLEWAQKKGLDIENLRNKNKLLEEAPFSLKTRMMTTVWKIDSKSVLLTKGAPEVILPLCFLSKKSLEQIDKRYKKMASLGLRVLAFGKKTSTSKQSLRSIDLKKIANQDLEFIGLVGIADAARSEARQAVKVAKKAGIKVIMITGDNELTARAIAEEIGILEKGQEVLTGAQLSEISDERLDQYLDNVRVFARVIPEHKLRIVQALQKKGEIVAVTGDGVNDALALKQSQIGVAMGITGTDVAKEASDIVILDDNFATIVTSIEQGRLIYHNLLKVVKFLLAGNFSEVLLIVICVLGGLPTPLLPAQILWINFVTDGLPALSLAADPSSSHLMTASPRKKGEKLLSIDSIHFILIAGLSISLITALVFYLVFLHLGVETARGWAFSTMVVLQMIMVFFVRKRHMIFSNKYLLLSVGFVLLMQILIITYPPLRELFKI